MSTLDDLQAAGFSEGEAKDYAAQQRQTLTAAGFSDDEINQHLGVPQQPDTLAANKQFSRVVGDALTKAAATLKPAGETVADVASVYAPIEAALNAGTGLLFGFPAYVGGALGGLVSKHLLGLDADPKELAETMSRVFTYQPMTQHGQRLAGNVMMPLTLLQQGSEAAGHGVTDIATKAGAGTNTAAALGAVTDATIQMLTPSVLGELARKMGGQTVTADDMRNTAKVIAGPEATHEAVATVEKGLQSTYQKTGIGPYTVLQDAHKDPQIVADLANPNVEVPKAYEQHVEKPAGPAIPTPGDGLPVLDLSDKAQADEASTSATAEEAAPVAATGEAAPAKVEGSEADALRAPEEEPVEMNAGLNPAASIRAIRDSYTPFVGVESPNAPGKAPPAVGGETPPGPRNPLVDSLQKIFAPASRGEIAQAQANIMRANFGEMAHEREVALTKMKGFAAQFDKMPVEDNIRFIDAMERGTQLQDPKLAEAATALRELLDSRRDQVQALGKGQLENFDENYFPHMWKDADAATALFSRRPLEGSKAFLKARTIPLTTDGLRWRAYDAEGEFVKSFDTEAQAKAAAGADGRVGAPLQPITTNPVEMALLKAREMDKYIYGQKIFAEMKDADLARFVRFGDRAQPGWTKINDKIARVMQPNEGEAGGMILRGEYYAPDEAATLINNHLSPGLQGNGFYDAWRGVGNAVNALQLGLSAFHVGFTTMDSMISRAALGVKQISRGDVLKGIGNLGQGLNPAQPFINIYKGDRLLRAYLGELDNPDLAPIVDAIQQAGGRVKMDDFYRNAQVNAFKQALRAEDYKGAAQAFVPTVLDRVGAPIFEWLVPRQKLGVFFDMAKDWLAENQKADVAAKREGLGKLWDSVDNRMGQLVYDNVFWNRALKDGLMATVRSVGWNLGTFRELGGGVLDVKDIGKNKGFSDRTAYVVALPMITAVYGSLLNYAYTGEAPQTLKDAFYPRTGRLRPDGSEDRVSLPTYMKDVFAYGEDAHNFAAYGSDPTQTIKNKMHPLIATVSQMLNNKDFFGGAIRNPADKAVEQVADEIKYLIQQIEPFSYRNYLQQAKEKGEEPSVMGYLTSPSMVGITPAPGYITKSPEELESAHVSQMHDSLVQKFKEQIRAGKDPETLIPEMLKSGMTKRDIKYIVSTSGDVPKPHRLKKFGGSDE